MPITLNHTKTVWAPLDNNIPHGKFFRGEIQEVEPFTNTKLFALTVNPEFLSNNVRVDPMPIFLLDDGETILVLFVQNIVERTGDSAVVFLQSLPHARRRFANWRIGPRTAYHLAIE